MHERFMGSIGFWGCLAIFAVPRLFGSSVMAEETTQESKTPQQELKYDLSKDKVLYMVGYAHLDTQWRWTYQDSINKFIPNTMHENFRLLEKYPHYTFNFTGARRYMMMKEYYPDDYRKVKEYISKGRWQVCGSSVDECDANIPSSESIIRHVLYGNDYFRKEFGKESLDFVLPDCFGFPAALPSILAHCGVKGFSTQKLSWGSAVGIPFTVGVWEGPDGNSIMAALDPGGYGSHIKHDLSRDEFLLKRINALGEKSGAYADYRYYGTGDIGGSPTEESVMWVEKSTKSDGPIKVVSSPGDQIFKDLSPDQIADLPRYKGDLLLTQHSAGCLTSQCYMKRWNRKNEFLADAAERAAVFAEWLGGSSYPREKLKSAWLLVLGSQMHDIMPGTCIPEAYENSWNDEAIAMNQFASVLENAAGAVASELDTMGEGIPLVVYNPLSIEREDIVEATISFEGNIPGSVRVFDPEGNEVSSQIIPKWNNLATVLFLARVPAMSFSVFDVRPSKEPCKIPTGLKITENSLENERYRVTLDQNGDVSSIRDKEADRELLSAPARLGFFEDFPREWPAWNMDWADKQKPAKSYVKDERPFVTMRESGPVRVALQVVRNAGGSEFTQIIRLAAGKSGDRLEFDTTIDWRTKETCLKACFPFSASNPKATYNQGLGTIERGNNDPKKYEVPSHKWIDLTDKSGKYGVAVLEDCKYGSDKPDDNTIRLSLVRTPGANSYQDQATQDLGVHQMLFALAGHKGDWREGDVQWKANRMNQPLIPFQAKPHPGKLGKSFSLLKINTNRVAVQAVKKAENSDEIIIRFQELLGAPCSDVEVSLGTGIVSARELNGQEQPIREASLSKGKLFFNIGPYEPKTFALIYENSPANLSKPLSRIVNIPYYLNPASNDKTTGGQDFDGKGRSYPAELLPSSLTCEGIEFSLGPSAKETPNALLCRGQKIALPSGKFNKLYFLAAAVGGDESASFQIDDRSFNLTIQEWTGKIGQWNNRIFSSGKKDILSLQPYFIKRDPIAWFASHIHNAKGENEPYSFCYLFRYCLDLPPGAKTLALPQNDRIRIFAITVAENPHDAVTPAKPLYDDLSQKCSEPRIEPGSLNFNDSVEIRISPGWFSRTSEVYFTTNGEDPGVSSRKQLYQKPFTIFTDTMVKACSLDENGRPGITAASHFPVNDITPPSILKVSSTPLNPRIVVEFSEPVEKFSAESMDHYELNPAIAITTAELSPDEKSVILSVSEKLQEEKEYILTVRGVKDRSPRWNTLLEGTISFSPVGHVLFMDFNDAEGIGNARVCGKTISAETRGKPASVAGKRGAGLRFSGNEECLILQDCPELNPKRAITIAAWFKADDWEGNRRILQKGNEDDQYRLLKEGDHFKFALRGVGEITHDVPDALVWHHVAGTWDGNAMRLFMDGKLVGETKAAGEIARTPDPLYIGTKTWGTDPGDFFKGELDELMIWEYALSLDQVNGLMGGK